jgi:hypothetical protein
MTTIDDASEVSLKAMIVSNKVKLENLKFLKHTHNIKSFKIFEGLYGFKKSDTLILINRIYINKALKL